MIGRDHLQAIARESDDLVDAAHACAPGAPVPSCPRWTVADLLEHIGRVHRWAAANSLRPPDAVDPDVVELGGDASILERFQAATRV